MTNTTTYKQTPIGLIPTDWEVKKLGQLGEVIGGLTYSPDDINEVEGTLVLRSSNIQAGKLVFDDNMFVKVNPEEYNPVQKDDILICVRNGSKSLIGKNALITQKAEGLAFGAFMAVFRSNHNKFLFQIFDTDIYYREIHQNLGATINSINGSDLKEFKVPFPPLPEQHKIATILSTWDAAIDKCKAVVDNVKQRNKGLAQQLLTGKIRVKGYEETKWNEKRLGNVFKERNECNQNSLQLLSIGERGVYPQDEDNKRDISNSDKSKYKKICIGDIGYNTMRMWQGRCAKSSYEGIVSPAYTIVFCKPNHFVIFYAYLFKQPFMMHKFLRVSQGLVEDTLNCKYKDFSIVPVNIPNDIEEQKAIANILDAATAELNQYQQQLQTLQHQKKGLMQQLLTGKTRVKIENE